jgi:hypothetical protein
VTGSRRPQSEQEPRCKPQISYQYLVVLLIQLSLKSVRRMRSFAKRGHAHDLGTSQQMQIRTPRTADLQPQSSLLCRCSSICAQSTRHKITNVDQHNFRLYENTLFAFADTLRFTLLKLEMNAGESHAKRVSGLITNLLHLVLNSIEANWRCHCCRNLRPRWKYAHDTQSSLAEH